MKTFSSIEEFAKCQGGEIATSAWLEVTQPMIDTFADVTRDDQWIHVDEERCQRELGHGTIAHGFMMMSHIAGFAQSTYRVEGVKRVINYGTDKIRFLSEVAPGDRIRGRFEMIELTPDKDRLKLRNKVTVELEGSEKPALVAETLLLYYV